ncbi:MAG TPA: hypothetical protein VEG25_07600 [Burkholderiales bacterium]|nr:hypothetical protein [Burkholderiales bacterium]
MLSNAAFRAPARTTLRETDSGAHYDAEERNEADAVFCRNPKERSNPRE